MNRSIVSTTGNRIFSCVVLLGLVVGLGLGVEVVLLALPLLALANLFFLRWPVGSPWWVVANATLRSLGLVVVLFLLVVGYIKVVGVGQMGYGDWLQVQGTHITLLGYRVILTEAARLGAVVWLAALLASFVLGKRERV